MSSVRGSTSDAVRIGSVLAGRFVVDGRLGVGAMAEVFRTTDLATGQSFAVKLLLPYVATDVEAVERLRREGALLSKLRHPSVVAVETYGRLEDDRLFIAMELLQGETLGARIERSRFDLPELLPIVRDCCSGLEAAHEMGVVHRDLKPENLFLALDERKQSHIKILDFGISKVYGTATLTATGQVIGTPRYMAPEQLQGVSDPDRRVDIYAMGVILYEALTQLAPFPQTNPNSLIVHVLQGQVIALRSYRPDLSEELEAVIARAMARDRCDRFTSAKELAAAFEQAASPQLDRPASQTAVAVQRAPATVALGSLDAPPAALAAPQAVQPVARPPATFRGRMSDSGAHGSHPAPGHIPASGKKAPAAVLAGAALPSTLKPSTTSAAAPLPAYVRPSRARLWLIVVGLLAAFLSAFGMVYWLRADAPQSTHAAPR